MFVVVTVIVWDQKRPDVAIQKDGAPDDADVTLRKVQPLVVDFLAWGEIEC